MENPAAYDWILVTLALLFLAGGFWMLFSNLSSVNKKFK